MATEIECDDIVDGLKLIAESVRFDPLDRGHDIAAMLEKIAIAINRLSDVMDGR